LDVYAGKNHECIRKRRKSKRLSLRKKLNFGSKFKGKAMLCCFMFLNKFIEYTPTEITE